MRTMLFLSDDWVAAVDESLKGVALDEPAGGPTGADQDPVDEAVIRYAVQGGPPGTGPYDLVLSPTARRARRPQGSASVTLTLDWALAVAINQGNESAQGAFLDGRIVIGGDPQALLSNADRLTAGNAQIAALRSRTVYEA